MKWDLLLCKWVDNGSSNRQHFTWYMVVTGQQRRNVKNWFCKLTSNLELNAILSWKRVLHYVNIKYSTFTTSARHCLSITFPWIIVLVLTRHCYWFVWSNQTDLWSRYSFLGPAYVFCTVVQLCVGRPLFTSHRPSHGPIGDFFPYTGSFTAPTPSYSWACWLRDSGSCHFKKQTTVFSWCKYQLQKRFHSQPQ